MKIYNNSEKFELTFGGQDIYVPEGLSEDFATEVAHHVKFIAEKWGYNVDLVTNAEEEAAILAKNEPKKEVEVKKEVKEEVKEEKSSK